MHGKAQAVIKIDENISKLRPSLETGGKNLLAKNDVSKYTHF